MGGGNWNDSDYQKSAAARGASGQSAFHYSQQMASAPSSARKAHKDLDPKGVKVRESRDSAEHPRSKGVAIFFDETGSMQENPEILQENLTQLFGLLLRKGYLEDPQILTGAYGDSFSDKVPLQVGQFESDIRVDEQLRNIFLEGNGGGNGGESGGLSLYFLSRHTSMDCWEKRGEKGYAFLIGDERPHDPVTFREVERFIGDEMESDVSIRDLVSEVEKTFNLFFLYVDTTSGEYQDTFNIWRSMIGERAIRLTDPQEVSSVIAATIGMLEAAVDLDGAVADLVDVGINPQIAQSVKSSLKGIAATTAVVAKSSGSGLPGLSGSGASERL